MLGEDENGGWWKSSPEGATIERFRKCFRFFHLPPRRLIPVRHDRRGRRRQVEALELSGVGRVKQ